MNWRRSLAIGVVASLTLSTSVGTALMASADDRGGGPSTEAHKRPRIDWEPCPEYSDEVLEALGMPDFEEFRAQWDRVDCGTMRVPLDYDDPRGRQITVAFTRLPATDRDRRLGALALNPGGPGGSGYLLPVELTVGFGEVGELNDQYDLIGFDPRGVGYSTQAPDCQGPDIERPEYPLTEADARRAYVALVLSNLRCAVTDPALLGSLTTGNVARDLDQIRRGLREAKMNYLGVSWGSWLGPVYRSLYPGRTGRMWIESVAPTDPRMDEFIETRSAATFANFSRMAEWMAQFDDTYGFGDTAAEVIDAIEAMRRDFEANPREFDDLPIPIDGEFIAIAGVQDAAIWPLAARILTDLRDATGPNAPESVKQVIGPPDEGGEPPEGMPEGGNRTMGDAVFCNGDGGARDFRSWWSAYQRRLETEPVTGSLSDPINSCAGWPLPVERIRLKDDSTSLVSSGHRYETPSPYEWTPLMQQAVGGRIFTVEDDVHGGALFAPDCATHLVEYFATGDPGADGCDGVPVPTGPDDMPEPPGGAGDRVTAAAGAETGTGGWLETGGVRGFAQPWTLTGAWSSMSR